MKLQLLFAAIALTVCSCNISREACFTGKPLSSNNFEMKVASTAAVVPTKYAGDVTLPLEEAQPINLRNNADYGIAENVAEEPIFIAMVPQENEENASAPAMSTVMAKELRAAAATIDNRFAQRIINRSANRMERMGSGIAITHKLTVFDKIKAKISQKFFAAYASSEGAMNILAIVSLVSGIVAFAYYAAFPFGPAAIVLGAIALAKGTDRRGMAIAGIVLGAIALAFWSGWIIAV